MSNIEFNKEGLLLLAKKITDQQYNLPLNFSLKTNQIQLNPFLYNSYIKRNDNSYQKDFIANESHEKINYPSKKGIKFKNKFLEKDNIQVNEEKMMKLLSERKRKKKLKLALSQSNNKAKINIGKNHFIYFNLENNEDNIINKISNTQVKNPHIIHYKYLKIKKYKTKFEKNNTYNENLHKFKSNKKPLLNSNSEYYNNNNSLGNFLTDRKSMKIIGQNLNINFTTPYVNNYYSPNKKLINYVRKEEIYNNFLTNNLNSNKKNNEFDIEDIDENINENDRNSKTPKNNISNNININININSNMNSNIISTKNSSNKFKKIESNKIRKRKKSFTRLFNTNKNISFRKNELNENNETVRNKINNTDYHQLIEEHNAKNNNSFRKIKRYISHNISDLQDKISPYKDDLKDNKDNNNFNYRRKNNEKEINKRNENKNFKFIDYNTYKNNNSKFKSNQKNNTVDKNKLNNMDNKNDINYISGSLIPNRPNSFLPKKTEIIDMKNFAYYESSSNNTTNNSRVYSSQLINKDKSLKKDNNNIGDKLESISKIIEKKYYNNKKFPNANNNIMSNNKSFSDKTSINNTINNKKDNIIQLEDLLILEGKFCHLFECLKYENPVPKIITEWWNFYTYSSFFGKFPKLFPKTNKDNNNNNYYILSDYQISHDAVMYELLSMIIIYKILCCSPVNQNLINHSKDLINEVHQNFLVECDYILSKVSSQSLNNLWIKKLKNLILAKKNWNENYIQKNFHLNLLKEGNNRIQNIIQYLINEYSKVYPNNNKSLESLTFFNKNISKMRLIDLSGYFNKAINQENIKINKAFSYIIKKNPDNKSKYISIIVPYLPEEIEDKKKYTLVLDLDETLISFRFDEKRRGIFKMRPGLFYFLNNIKNFYEIIIFTAGTQEYADPILDIIEKKGKLFAKRLYRQHTILMNNIYIKDLTRLGRDLSKTIIVDNMPQNFCLQKENGILIKNFFGEDKNETTLKDLCAVLLKIASRPDNDVRKELKKFREEIFTKITTNLKC